MIQYYAKNCENSNIKIYIDNKSALKCMTRAGSTTSAILQDLAIQVQELCNHRKLEPDQDTTLRDVNTKENIPNHTTTTGEVQNRRLRSKTQSSTPKILVNANRSNSSSRCNESTLIEAGNIPLLSLEANPTSIEMYSRSEVDTNGASNPNVIETILVPDDPQNETYTTTNNLETQQEVVSSCLATIYNNRLQAGLDK
ncbi:hypothetical protein G6F43_009797 [Rhizopus delemar]|nr:hypothetical protein G6F43_009797 [Rhizopus delemar]